MNFLIIPSVGSGYTFGGTVAGKAENLKPLVEGLRLFGRGFLGGEAP